MSGKLGFEGQGLNKYRKEKKKRGNKLEKRGALNIFALKLLTQTTLKMSCVWLGGGGGGKERQS